MSQCTEVINGINWKQLREQKDYCENEAMNAPDISHIYEGIAVLLVRIQHAAVADGLVTEKQAFGARR